MFGELLLFKPAAVLVLTILTVVPAVTPLAELNTSLAFIVPLVDTEYCVRQSVVTEELGRPARDT